MARGDHEISGLVPPQRGTPPPPPKRGGNWPMVIIACIALAGLWRFVGGSNDDATPAAPAAVLAPVAAPAASAPVPPEAPRAKLAHIEAALPAAVNPLSLTLGGGDYGIGYETSDTMPSPDSLGTASVCTMNFNDGSVEGDPKTADVMVLIGTLTLKVVDIAQDDKLYVNILSKADNVNAYFNFATSERGPPAVTKTRRVIVVGRFDHIDLPGTHDASEADIKILDLNPSEADQRQYEDALQQYQVQVEAYRASIANAAQPAFQSPEDNDHHQTDVHPSEYHPPAYHPPVHPPVHPMAHP